MIDSLLACIPRLKEPSLYKENHLREKKYSVLTLHRPSNVDDPNKFSKIIQSIDKATDQPIVFPVHLEPEGNFQELLIKPKHVIVCDPLGYFDFVYLIKNASLVITDSRGVQEETTVLDVPCVTLRKNTERPETVTFGSNVLTGEDLHLLIDVFKKVNEKKWKSSTVPELWDGRAAVRIVDYIVNVIDR